MSKRRRKPKRKPAARPPQQLFQPVMLPNETLWFVLVNVLDYFMTFIILYKSNELGSPLQLRLIESNPIAAYFINHWGPLKGLLGFKLGMVAAICLITQRIAHHQPRTAKFVLNFGTLVTTIVVIYSVSLLIRAYG
ncbi:MAG: hypothetical protein KDA93_12855 [Planctomycetaceae bacterium]|nr:hypothetical protein [Planctomycetaceae bacterium]